MAAQTAAKRCGRRPAAAASSAAVARQASSAVRSASRCTLLPRLLTAGAFADSSDNKASPEHNQTCPCKKSKPKPPPPPTPCFTENNTVFPCVAPCFCQDRWNSSQINSTDHIRYSSVYNLSLRESFPALCCFALAGSVGDAQSLTGRCTCRCRSVAAPDVGHPPQATCRCRHPRRRIRDRQPQHRRIRPDLGAKARAARVRDGQH